MCACVSDMHTAHHTPQSSCQWRRATRQQPWAWRAGVHGRLDGRWLFLSQSSSFHCGPRDAATTRASAPKELPGLTDSYCDHLCGPFDAGACPGKGLQWGQTARRDTSKLRRVWHQAKLKDEGENAQTRYRLIPLPYKSLEHCSRGGQRWG